MVWSTFSTQILRFPTFLESSEGEAFLIPKITIIIIIIIINIIVIIIIIIIIIKYTYSVYSTHIH